RHKCINKGFTYADFTKAAEIAHKAGAGVKAYLLFKPLFLTEAEAVADMKSSLAALAGNVEMVSMNPCTVQKRTELESYWRQGAYRPPYLWSVLSIIRDAPVEVTCDPLGGGQKRGPHNCGTCDYEITRGIRDYSLTGDRDLIGALLDMDCTCKSEWEYVLAHERPYCMPLTR
ncbi:MAG: TIGR01210 family radical SAM protein, partial [Methanoregula sp.]